MTRRPNWFIRFIQELRRRRVIQVLGAYVAGAFVVLEGASLVLEPLGFDEGLYRVLVGLALAGLPVVIALAWAYDLTSAGPRRTGTADEAGATPGEATQPIDSVLSVRQQLRIFGLFVLAAFAAVGITTAIVGGSGSLGSDDRGLGLAVFPFRHLDPEQEDWTEGAPDLLATLLDGGAGLRVADPWTLWRPLRSEPSARAQPPDPIRASRLAERAGASTFLLSSVVEGRDSVVINVRTYEVGREEPSHVFAVASADLLGAVRSAAVAILSRLAVGDGTGPPELVQSTTGSPEAMKAYLAAREAVRRGMLDSAEVAIDRAIAEDSTFVLALVEATTIKSWAQQSRGEQYHGLRELVEKAAPYADSVSQRTRLRLRATAASIETDGATAYEALSRIIAMDSTDIRAWHHLTFVLQVYGWQFGGSVDAAREAARRVVALDSTFVPGLAARAAQSVWSGDPEAVRQQLDRMLRIDSTSVLGRSIIAGLRAVLADGDTFAAMLPRLADAHTATLLRVLWFLRPTDPDRAAALLGAMLESDQPVVRQIALGEASRLWLTRGRATPVDSVARAIEARGSYDHLTHRELLVGASLAGWDVGPAADSAVAALARHVPVDSVNAYFDRRPVWSQGWLVGAYNATRGDTVLARRWVAAFDTMPVGGSPPQWGAALAADIEARIAAREGRGREALARARDAFRLWSIHTENDYEMRPEPQIRMHLAALYQAAEMPDSARAIYRSFVPPAAWFGFLTARAHFELAELARQDGDREAERRHLATLVRYWEDAGPAVAHWREGVFRRLESESG